MKELEIYSKKPFIGGRKPKFIYSEEAPHPIYRRSS